MTKEIDVNDNDEVLYDEVLYDGMWGNKFVSNPYANEMPAVLVQEPSYPVTDEWVKVGPSHRNDDPGKIM